MRTFLILLLSCLPLAAFADSQPLTYDRISFNEEASVEVDNDLLVAVMFIQREGRQADRPAEEVNRVMNQALSRAKQESGIKVQTLNYHTGAIYKKNEVRGWRVNHSLRLESRDSKKLGALIGELQSLLNVQSISYQVSEERRRQHMDALIEQALQRFQARAKLVSRSMGREGFRVVSLNINPGHTNNPVRFRSEGMMASMSKAAPCIEAGSQRLQVSVHGEIELERP